MFLVFRSWSVILSAQLNSPNIVTKNKLAVTEMQYLILRIYVFWFFVLGPSFLVPTLTRSPNIVTKNKLAVLRSENGLLSLNSL